MSSSLHLCLLHGWAANGHIFDSFAAKLPAHWHISTPHLPGHGDTPLHGAFSIDAAAEQIAAGLPERSVLFGWSLGGLVALHIAARYPEKVSHLVLCASFAKFLAADGYPEGLKQPALAKMIVLFEQDYPKYMRQFIELQLLHTPERAEIMEAVLPDMVKHGTPQALSAALDALSAADARALLPDLAMPVWLVYGGKDTITPLRMGKYLARQLPQAQLSVFDKAAHAPFLSHADEVAQGLQRFVAEH